MVAQVIKSALENLPHCEVETSPVKIRGVLETLGSSAVIFTLVTITTLMAPTSLAQDEQPVYSLLSEMRLPWAYGDAEPRMLTQDWWSGHTADGLAWDLGRSGAPTPSPVAGTDVLAPMAGYVTAVRQQDPGYGNYVDIQGEQDWAVRLAHLQQQSGVRSEFSGTWIPRAVPIGQLGKTGSSDYPYHIHLELLWQGGRPPQTGNDYPDDYLPPDSQPFGLTRSSLERPTEDREIVSNQDRYRPTLDVSWPLRGCAVVKGRTSYLSLSTVEPSKLHQYRWHVTRATDQTTVAQSDWSDSPDSGNSLQALERGEYEWWAQARFPDIRYAHEDEWFESDARTEPFRVLDLGNPFDWPAYLYYRFLTRCVMAAPRGAPDNPPPPLPPPSVAETQQPSPTPTASPMPSALRQGRIAFHSERDGEYYAQIYVMDADGAELTRLTNNRAGDYDPAWSPDGKRIAFASARDANFGFEIYVMRADGTEPTRLTFMPGDDRSPSWSPDGRRIAYATNFEGAGEIYVMNADGSDHTNLTNSAAHDSEPSWSPDGSRIAFTSYRDSYYAIYVIQADGSEVTRLTNSQANDWAPCWSPDGKRIAFSSLRDGNPEIYVTNADGSEQRKLTSHPSQDMYPCWSPNGQHIVFESTPDGNFDIYVMNADGSGITRLTYHPLSDQHPSWSPG